MEQQQKISSTQDEIEQNLTNMQLAVYQSCMAVTKGIQKEKQKISILTQENKVIFSEEELLRDAASNCERDTLTFRAQSIRNSEICNSHKKNNELLDQHLFELAQSLNAEKQKETSNKKFYDEKISVYQEKWQEYFTMYAKHPLFPQYEEAKRRHIELEEYSKSAESELRKLQAELFKTKCERSRKNSEESKYYPMQNFVVWIAQLRYDTTKAEKQIKENFKQCSDLRAQLNQLRSSERKGMGELLLDTGDSRQHVDNVKQGNYERKMNAAKEILSRFSAPSSADQPKKASTAPKITLFIPKLSSVASAWASRETLTSQRLNEPAEKSKNSSFFRPSNPVTAAMGVQAQRLVQTSQAKNVAIKVETSSRSRTPVFKVPLYTPSLDAKVSRNVLKNDSDSGGTSSPDIRHCNTSLNSYVSNFESSANFTSAPSSTRSFEGQTHPQSTSSNAQVEIKKSRVSPYFAGTPKLSGNVQSLRFDSKALSPEDGDKVWEQNAANMSYTPSASTSSENPSSRALSPFDIVKHMKMLKDLKKSPEFGYQSRNMYTIGDSNDNGVDNTREKHEIMDSGLFCSTLLGTGTAAQSHEPSRLSENASASQRHERGEMFSVEKLCDSPKVTAGTEKSLFSFNTTSENKPSRSSVFSLFGDDDTDAPSAIESTSSFSFNFAPSKEEKTETSSFKFLF